MADEQNNTHQITEPEATGASSAESPIHVIPEQYYGAALKTKLKAEPLTAGGGKPSKGKLPLIIVLFILLAVTLAGGYFVFLNKDTFFPAQEAPPVAVQPTTTQPEPPPPPPPPPSAPSSLTATSTGPQSVSLSWIDTSNNEAAFKIERRTAERTIYDRITDLPPNSTSFQDSGVSASTTYYYRVISRNETGESDASNEAMVITRPLPPPPKEPEPLPPAGLDTDSDGLTDLEEVIFTSDPRNPDSDGDGFLDGNEVFNQYNPMGRAPARLSGSGLVKEINGSLGWTMLIPTDWTLIMNKPDGSEAVIDTGHGEKFVLTIENNGQQTDLIQWFMARYPEVDSTHLMKFKSKGGYEGIIGPDLLTTYITWGDRIFIFKYDMGNQPFINYRTVYSMILNSLVLTGLPQQIVPAGTGQLPFEPGATEPGDITQPEPVTPTSTMEVEDVGVEEVEDDDVE